MDLDAVSIKLPPVWTHRIDSWFAQAEAQFNLRKITEDDTKYWHIVAALTDEVAERCARIIDRPPTSAKYQAIKDFLLRRYGLTDAQRAELLLSIKSLGDRTPTQLADEMLRINGEHDPKHYLLRQLFVRVLPSSVQQQLATTKKTDLYDLAEEAEMMLAVRSAQAMAVDVDTVSDDDQGAAPSLCALSSDLCYFHRRFGKKARRCQPPCSWQQQGNAKRGPRRQ
jgi:hypothetical protein